MNTVPNLKVNVTLKTKINLRPMSILDEIKATSIFKCQCNAEDENHLEPMMILDEIKMSK